MNLTQYNKKRDELSNLLQDVVTSLETVDNEYKALDMSSLRTSRNEIAAIRQKVYEDFYKIVLVAKFQGGKSTSFNAITGGTCISPMGNGSIKCSASLVSAKSVVNPDDVGVTVRMRTVAELSELVAMAALPGADLTSAQSLAEIKSAWQTKFELWKETPQLFKTDEERDMFFVAGFILEFFNDRIIQEYLQKKTFEISFNDISKFAKFPEDYTVRYSQKGPGAFDVEEAVYAFVSRVDARVQSSDMAKIGASFVDAPGLLANSYDTRVTRAELSDASAVWYLLSAMQPGEKELEAIKECWELSKGRVLISSNIIDNKSARHIWIDKVLPSIRQNVTNVIGDIEVKPYHALLALLYIQGEYYVQHGHWADDSVTSFLISNCAKVGVPEPDQLPVEECWKISARIAMNGLNPYGSPEYDALPNPLSPEGLAIIRRESNWDGTVEAIREFVVNSKSETVLITDTSQKALELINNLKLLLKRQEDDANKSFEETNAAYLAANAKLKKFEQFAREHIERNLSASRDTMVAQGLYEDVFLGSVSDVAQKAAPLVAAKMGLFRIAGAKVVQWGHQAARCVANWFRDNPIDEPVENAHAVEVTQIMKSSIDEIMGKRLIVWIQQTKDGQNRTFQEAVVIPARTTFELLRTTWEQDCSDDELLKGMMPVRPEIPRVLLDGRFDSSSLLEYISSESLSEFVKDVIVSCLWGLGGVWCLCIEPVTAAIIAFIILILRQLMGNDQMEERIRDKIKDELSGSYSKLENRQVIVRNLASKISVFRETVIGAIQKPFKEVRERFNAAMDAALANHMRSAQHRATVAQESKEIRENYIEGEKGLEQRLETYIKETKPLCVPDASLNSAGKMMGE